MLQGCNAHSFRIDSLRQYLAYLAQSQEGIVCVHDAELFVPAGLEPEGGANCRQALPAIASKAPNREDSPVEAPSVCGWRRSNFQLLVGRQKCGRSFRCPHIWTGIRVCILETVGGGLR